MPTARLNNKERGNINGGLKTRLRMKFGEGPYSYQQNVYAMRGFNVGIKSIFLIKFGNGGQFGDGRQSHSLRSFNFGS
jgi:hypothetical protein